jgi:hypothetical protein
MGDEGKAVGSTQAPAALLSDPQFGRGVAARQATLWRVNRFSGFRHVKAVQRCTNRLNQNTKAQIIQQNSLFTSIAIYSGLQPYIEHVLNMVLSPRLGVDHGQSVLNTG